MIRNLIIFQFMLLTATSASAIDCIGSKDSKKVAVYLHGIDTEPPSTQEIQNRLILSSISKKLKMGFAVPRAKNKCPDNKSLCWGWNFNDSESVESAIITAKATKLKCFPKATSAGLIGFSNGGFVVNQIIKGCRKTEFSWFISIGAGSSWSENDKKDLSKCSSLILMAGKKDKFNYEPIKELGKWFKDQKANVNIVEFNDGHSLPEKDLENILKSFILE